MIAIEHFLLLWQEIRSPNILLFPAALPVLGRKYRLFNPALRHRSR
jgi:hypothetical protein